MFLMNLKPPENRMTFSKTGCGTKDAKQNKYVVYNQL